jgi:hypothetical protein
LSGLKSGEYGSQMMKLPQLICMSKKWLLSELCHWHDNGKGHSNDELLLSSVFLMMVMVCCTHEMTQEPSDI